MDFSIKSYTFLYPFLPVGTPCLSVCGQNANPSQFSLVEVMLDKGVSERELSDDEKPWLIMQRNRRVSLTTISLLLLFR